MAIKVAGMVIVSSCGLELVFSEIEKVVEREAVSGGTEFVSQIVDAPPGAFRSPAHVCCFEL